MTMNVPPRYRLPIAILASLGVVAVVLVAVLLAGGVGPVTTPTPTPTSSASALSDPTSTPEGAVRAFFEAFGRGRRTDDPTLALAFVTSDKADAYLSISAFLQGQKDKGKGSVLTVQRLDNMAIAGESSSEATVTFDYVEGGYDVDLTTGAPLESPNVLPVYHVTAIVKKVDARWLVDSYMSRQ
jgi:hypothetical protein